MRVSIGMTAEDLTRILNKSLAEWGCELKYAVNWNAMGNSQQVSEIVDGDIYSRLHERGNNFFVEIRQKGDMYPRVYSVTKPTYNASAISEAEYITWLSNK